jgi:uncharacterized protein YhdP
MTHAPQQRGRSPTRRAATGAVRVLAWAGIAGVTIVVLAAAAILLALPAAEQRPQAVADWLGEQLGRELRLGSIELAWRDGAPVVVLGNLHVGEPGSPVLALGAAEVRNDALASLRAWRLRPPQVTVRGARVQVQRRSDGSLQMGGLGADPITGAGAAHALLLDAVPGAAGFAVEDATVTLHGFGPAQHAQTPVVLTPVSMHLRTEAGGLRLSGALATPAAPASPLRFTLRWPDRNADPLASAEITLSTRELHAAGAAGRESLTPLAAH